MLGSRMMIHIMPATADGSRIGEMKSERMKPDKRFALNRRMAR